MSTEPEMTPDAPDPPPALPQILLTMRPGGLVDIQVQNTQDRAEMSRMLAAACLKINQVEHPAPPKPRILTAVPMPRFNGMGR